jgi:hypothetical protein
VWNVVKADEEGDVKRSSMVRRIRKAVRREGAPRYLLITLLSFAASVGLTRLFLELTGYPQLGNAELHIAHVLWGGLFLFVAAVLPLIFANRWVYVLGSLFAGLGVGLFIDEVGKFITQTNNYFYPAAAPIIYATFLITVMVYLQVRTPPERDARDMLYGAIDGLAEVLDYDLEPSELRALQRRLQRIVESADHQDLARLASSLLQFLDSDALRLAPEVPGFLERWLARLRRFEERWITASRLKAALIGGIAALGLYGLIKLGRLLLVLGGTGRLESLVDYRVIAVQVAGDSGVIWFIARMGLEVGVALFLIAAAIALFLGKDRLGSGLAYLGLLLSLTAVNLLVFYFEQFSTMIKASIEFIFLLGILYFRRYHVEQSFDD